MLDPIPADAQITALNPTQMNYGGICAALAGACLQVQGPRGTAAVYVTGLMSGGWTGGGRPCGADPACMRHGLVLYWT
ncbi:hypothetical protein ACFQGW_12420 [Xanthomonas theicola]|uniref:hypothetical protein n=1 Tax=Xanthomonas theicola TaxID=56464 RepID=UPI003615D417